MNRTEPAGRLQRLTRQKSFRPESPVYDPKFLLTASLLIALFTAFASQALAGDVNRPVILGTVPNPKGDAPVGALPETGDEVLTTFEQGDIPSTQPGPNTTLKPGGGDKRRIDTPRPTPDGTPPRTTPGQ